MKTQKKSKAFSLVEVLVALAISAVLLAAVAVAFNASIVNYNDNRDISSALNTARQAIMRITNELRCASAVDTTTPSNQCTFMTADGRDITYKFDSTSQAVYLVTNYDLFDSNYLLCENITDMSFDLNTATADGQTYVKAVMISMTIQNGNFQKTITSGAVIRKNLE
ncbi:MAG: prepilin-type N-terminal cleavage/methylation domain-containing protein [Planctomycetes bacterium]|nr:prepilin-type N-terminal cleavage/methylation domain-containing protein [Planctomycetota bacterium]MBL7106587.1 prepilin-type N-terminal cleavage/methylation domain-containing protein [Phycisphaerae bacterium]